MFLINKEKGNYMFFKKQNKFILPDIPEEVAEQYYYKHLDLAQEMYDEFNKRFIISLMMTVIIIGLNIAVALFKKNIDFLSFFLLCGVYIAVYFFWIYKSYQCLLFTKKQMEYEKKSEIIMGNYSKINELIKNKKRNYKIILFSYYKICIYKRSFLFIMLWSPLMSIVVFWNKDLESLQPLSVILIFTYSLVLFYFLSLFILYKIKP